MNQRRLLRIGCGWRWIVANCWILNCLLEEFLNEEWPTPPLLLTSSFHNSKSARMIVIIIIIIILCGRLMKMDQSRFGAPITVITFQSPLSQDAGDIYIYIYLHLYISTYSKNYLFRLFFCKVGYPRPRLLVPNLQPQHLCLVIDYGLHLLLQESSTYTLSLKTILPTF